MGPWAKEREPGGPLAPGVFPSADPGTQPARQGRPCTATGANSSRVHGCDVWGNFLQADLDDQVNQENGQNLC